MIFNLWRPFKYIKPRKSGKYQCTIKHGCGIDIPDVVELYYTEDSQWVNKNRQNVFDGYKVYNACREPIEVNRVYTDSACLRIDVVAWRDLPRPCKIWR